MRQSQRLLARLLPFALPLTVACGAKSELLEEDPNESAAGRAGSGGAGGATAGRAGTGGGTSAGAGGTIAAGGFSSAGAGGTNASAGRSGAGTQTELPPCALPDMNCPTFCYVGSADETCLPSFPEQPVHERFGCEVQIAGSTTAPGQKPGECCYIVGFCGGGRPIVVAGQTLLACLRKGDDWT